MNAQILFESGDKVPEGLSGFWTDSDGCRVRVRQDEAFPECSAHGKTYWHRYP